ncbi:MAG TPA: hypothetical protein VFI08_09745, partial [Spirochaetia bacterium]|nr:hypothetical protein [Spirochaetia bacterium]
MNHRAPAGVLIVFCLFVCLVLGGGWYVWSSLLGVQNALRQSTFSYQLSLYPVLQQVFNVETALQAFLADQTPANRELLELQQAFLGYQVHHFASPALVGPERSAPAMDEIDRAAGDLKSILAAPHPGRGDLVA